ncbi:hypothetical protein [Evansella cellulosilytica]|uniref:Uncharacterized protein n=1 Tax=Evansella cellulosilytica (strain ATCC 21833 / DSM 2522 / FERM P-1141 / JCM 9156 / N-4) TaxID=649639 RepID=E6U248_EVAC2|nr:hypothetical protein [Evansella cellulosilytica]ADU30426.1 hypothetical protein Bcell_2165 [Evansella cellulosilytica DSM 2522]
MAKSTLVFTSDTESNIKELFPSKVKHITIIPFHEVLFSVDYFYPLIQQYDEIILSQHILNRDHFLQGNASHFSEMFIYFIYYLSSIQNKQFFIWKEDEKSIVPYSNNGIIRVDSNKRKPRYLRSEKTITSIQKYNLPRTSYNHLAKTYMEAYFSWLPTFFRGIIVKESFPYYSFHFRPIKYPLLVFKFNKTIHHSSITELKIIGGILKKKGKSSVRNNGRFLFVVSPNKRELYTAIIHFCPALPWSIYRMSQSLLHRFVMYCFKRYIEKEIQSPS